MELVLQAQGWIERSGVGASFGLGEWDRPSSSISACAGGVPVFKPFDGVWLDRSNWSWRCGEGACRRGGVQLIQIGAIEDQ